MSAPSSSWSCSGRESCRSDPRGGPVTQVQRRGEQVRITRSPDTRPDPRRRMSASRREAMAGYLFISPWIVGFLRLHARRDGLQPGHLVQPLQPGHRTGSGRRARQLRATCSTTPRWRPSLGNTLFYAVMAVPLEIVVRAGPRAAAQPARPRRRRLPHHLLPAEDDAGGRDRLHLPPAAQRQHGRDQPVPRLFGIEGPQWLIDPTWVKPSIVLMTLWGVSGTMVIFLAALKNVPRELYEVAVARRRRRRPARSSDHRADDLGAHLLQRDRADHRGACRSSTRRTCCSGATRPTPRPSRRCSTASTSSSRRSASSTSASPPPWPGCCS